MESFFWCDLFISWIQNHQALCGSRYLSSLYVLYILLIAGLDKKRAWIPSILSSGFLFATCTPVAISWLANWATGGSKLAGQLLIQADDYSDTLMIVFLTFLYFDLIVSHVRFPGHMELMSGWIHHIVYIALVSSALRWRWTNGLVVCFVEEGPTLVLGLGQAYPHLFKSENVFGWSFLLLRLVFHSAVTTVALLEARHQSFMWLAGLLSLALHVWWYFGWVKRQRRLGKAKRRLSQVSLDARIRDKLRKSLNEPSVFKLDSMLVQETLGSAESPYLIDQVENVQYEGSQLPDDDIPLVTQTPPVTLMSPSK